MGWVVFAGIVLIGIGAFLFLNPDLMWKLTEQWKSYRADGPSVGGLTPAYDVEVEILPCGRAV